jgi:hypothetical protein
MTHYKHQPVVIVPAAKRDAVNAVLQKHGYGPNMVSTPCIGKTSSSNAPATHYVVECAADEGLLAALKLAIAKVAGAKMENAKRGQPNTVSVLDKNNLKPKGNK